MLKRVSSAWFIAIISVLSLFVALCLVVFFLLFADKPLEQKSSQSLLQMASGKPVTRGKTLVFPQDHGIHPEQGIEWWYLTANLKSDTGETFGVQWTLFRTLMPSELQSQWWDNNLYFAHFAMQHKQEHVAFERFSRASQAKVTSLPFNAAIDDWQLSSINTDFLPLHLTASQENYNVSLTLSDSPVTFHGDKGYSQKTQSGHASYYYSYPFLKVEGNVNFAGKEYKVTGNAWYDREWSASLLDSSQLGWDWFSLVDSQSSNQSSNQSSKQSSKKGLMLFCIRGDGQRYDYCSGTRIAASGEARAIAKENIKLSVIDTVTLKGREYPSKWQVELPNEPIIIIESITKDSRNQLTVPYWEGRVKVSGGFNGKGYAELTGY
jgi:predicted secreted hydrolase